MTTEPLPVGLREDLITQAVQERLADVAPSLLSTARVDDADAAHVLARHIYALTRRALDGERDPHRRLDIVTRLVNELGEYDASVVSPARQLLQVSAPAGPGSFSPHARPATPLSDAALLTNTSGEPSLGGELRAEIDTADEVDLLCAFVKWHGLRVLEPELHRLRLRGTSLRVITTTYVGATERRALDRLVREFGAEVKVQYDAQRTRLHAKAWMFRRRTGYDTAYVGSSNLSKAALLDGVEWNVRLSKIATPTLLDKFAATFDTYWSDPSYEQYDPETDADRLDDALAEAGGRHVDRVTISLSGLEVSPYPYQQEMLNEIEAERVVHGRHRNLVVAATGTGKTVIAALDYRRLCRQSRGVRPRLLFVAHRKEILHQSIRTYREVLGDGAFGELYVDGTRPERWEHVFASIQSLSSYGVENIPADAFDVVVIDEFHHAAASSYSRLINQLTPQELLGLTATPERADGINVQDAYFDGRIATELRLWEALGADLLCPFHYFAVSDGTDLRDLTWAQGKYDPAQLAERYVGNDDRARVILTALQDKVIDPLSMRALGFCVTVAHAEYMARVFNQAGIPATTVTGTSTSEARAQALDDLRARRLNIVFAVDVFNEGLDLPAVDTVLFLRPTESATVFLQQLGRGLRRTADKAVLTVLDFVGLQHRNFRWDRKLRALTGLTRAGLERELRRNFPLLPAGCQILMDQEAQSTVLENIRAQVASRWSQIVSELRSYGDMDLPTFLHESGLELPDLIRQGRHSWTKLRRDAGLPTPAGAHYESHLLKRVRALAHVDDPLRAREYLRLLSNTVASYEALEPRAQRLAEMLFFSLWPDGGGLESYDAGLRAVRSEPAARAELATVVDYAFDNARSRTFALDGSLSDIPLRIHASYQREEILSALRYADLTRKPTSVMQGVAYSAATNTDIFFITLKKSAADFSPTTMYRDYPISPTLFHWESQSTTTVSSPTGQRYINGTSTVLLFVREQEKNAYGTSPYLFLGPAAYVSHRGERPIAITWELEQAMPTDFFHRASVAAE